MSDTVTMSRSECERLRKIEYLLELFKEYGIVDWEYYDDVMEDYNNVYGSNERSREHNEAEY